MTNKKQVKKVQVSIPIEQYRKIEDMWLSLGFSSVAEACKFLLMNNVAEFYKQVKKSQKAILKLHDLKVTSKKFDSAVAHVQPAAGDQISKTLSVEQQTSGYIKKDSFEYKRIVSKWQKQNSKFVEPLDIKGLRWWIDEKTKKIQMGWWRNGNK